MGGLTKNSAEAQSLPDSGGVEMEILLLDVTSLTLEGLVPRATVNQHLTSYDTHCHTSCEHVQKSRFTSTRNTLRS